MFLLRIKPLRTERLYEGKIVAVADIAEYKSKAASLIEPEEQIQVEIMGDLNFCHLHSCVFTLESSVAGRCGYIWNLSVYISR